MSADEIIALFHSSLFAGHQGIIKLYLTMNEKFFFMQFSHSVELIVAS